MGLDSLLLQDCGGVEIFRLFMCSFCFSGLFCTIYEVKKKKKWVKIVDGGPHFKNFIWFLLIFILAIDKINFGLIC